MRGGFLSDEARDIIAILGLLLAVLQLIFSFLTPALKDENNSSNQPRRFRGTLFPNAFPERLKILASLIRWPVGIAFGTFILLFLISIAIQFGPTSDWFFGSLAMIGMLASLMQYGTIVFALSEADGWLMSNLSSTTQKKIWRVFLTTSPFIALFACIFILNYLDMDAGLIQKIIGFQVIGLLSISMLVSFAFAVETVGEYFERRKVL